MDLDPYYAYGHYMAGTLQGLQAESDGKISSAAIKARQRAYDLQPDAATAEALVYGYMSVGRLRDALPVAEAAYRRCEGSPRMLALLAAVQRRRGGQKSQVRMAGCAADTPAPARTAVTEETVAERGTAEKLPGCRASGARADQRPELASRALWHGRVLRRRTKRSTRH